MGGVIQKPCSVARIVTRVIGKCEEEMREKGKKSGREKKNRITEK